MFSRLKQLITKKTTVMALAALALISAVAITPQTVHADAQHAAYGLNFTISYSDGSAVQEATLNLWEYTASPSGSTTGEGKTYQFSSGSVTVPASDLELGKTYSFGVSFPNSERYTIENGGGYVFVNPDPIESDQQFEYNSEFVASINTVVTKPGTSSDTVKVNLSFAKHIVGTDHTTLTTPMDKQFKFDLYKIGRDGTETLVGTAYNDAEGKLSFSDIEITKDDGYAQSYSSSGTLVWFTKDNRPAYVKFKLVETSDSYATDGSFATTPDGTNELYISAPVGQYESQSHYRKDTSDDSWMSEFTFDSDTINYSDELYNLTYKPVKFKISAKKVYQDSEGNSLALTDKQFTFKLMGTTNDGKETTIATGYNDTEGNIVFDADTTVATVSNGSSSYKEVNDFYLFEVVPNTTDGYENTEFRCETPFYQMWNRKSYSSALLTKDEYELALKGYGNGLNRWDDFSISTTYFELNGEKYTSYSKVLAAANIGDTIKEIGDCYSTEHSWSEVTTYIVDGSDASKYLSYVSEEKTNIEEIDGTIEKEFTFTNVKKIVAKLDPATIVISGKKTLTDKTGTGRVLKADEFSFELKDSDGNVVDTVKNDAEGNVTFKELSFEKAGEYTYTINEVKGSESGVVYDDSVKTIVIVVTEDAANNTLVASIKTGL